MTSLPLYQTVYHELRHRIIGQQYPPGSSLPSERRLIGEFGVSLITIRRAMDELVLDGLVERRQGVGSFVREQPRSVAVAMSTFTTDVLTGRLRLVRTLLEDASIPSTGEVSARLGVQGGSMVRRLVRLDSEGGSPLSLDEAFVPPALAAAITSEIAGSPSFLHLWQARAGIALARTEFEASARMPTKRERELLGVGADVPLLVTAELIHASDGRPAAWIVTRYRADRTRLHGAFDLAADKSLPRP